MTACLSSRTMQLAAVSSSACNSRTAAPAAAGRRALAASLPAAAARPSTSLQAIAGAREAAVEAPKEQRPRPQPAVEVFPATSTSRMLNDNRGFVESHRIRGDEVGPDQKTTIVSIAKLLQEAAGNHAVAMWGRSTEGFASDPSMRDLIFVMTRMQIQMEHYPRWGDLVQIETWFQEDGKLAAQRDFLITELGSRRVLGRATSTWVTINIATRRLSKFPELMREKCDAFQLQPPRHAIPRQCTRQKIPDLDMPAEIVGPIQVARRGDMDMNGHVNNVMYLAWALETVPNDVFHGRHLYQIEVDFKAECHSGELVESLAGRTATHELLSNNGAGPDALSYTHVLRRCQGEVCTELVRARTTWRTGEPV